MFSTRSFALIGGLALNLFVPLATAVEKAAPTLKDTEAQALVLQALDNELAGDAEGRQTLLERAVASDPQYAAAHWHLGNVRHDDQWLAARQAMAKVADSPLNAEYQTKRDEAAGNSALELKLAQWCIKEKMPDRARLHFWRVLTNSKSSKGQIEDAAKQLDLVSVGGTILTRTELKKEQERERRIAEAIGKYRPLLAQLQSDIDGGFGQQHDLAAAKLTDIDDPAVIPAVETFLNRHREGFGEELVKVLTKFRQVEATQTLARYAVVSPFLSVRERAIEELKKRPLHDYMPTLLAGLIAPIQSQFKFAIDRRGNIAYRHSYASQGAAFDIVAHKNTLFRPMTASSIVYTDRPRKEISAPLGGNVVPVDPRLILMELGLTIEMHELAANAANLAAAESNKRTIAVLEQTTAGVQQPKARDPQSWWQWWQKYNEVQYRKPTYQYFTTSQRYYARQYAAGFLTTHPSCFLAGTPIWTEVGMRRIDSVQPGDRVLSQNPDSGELCFKVVTGKTIRPPTDISQLTINGETITTTLGHPLWVAGKGWEMAKHINAGDQLHGIGGIINVNDVQPLPRKAEAHNLVVDDFNSYFVGNCGMLVHDNTHRKPTRALLPGLIPDEK